MTLFRTRDIIMVVLMIGMAFWTYDVKYAARRDYQHVQNLEQKIEVEKDAAKLLKARWALATNPARIERLANQYYSELQLEPITGRQIVKVSDIPVRVPDDIEKVIEKGDLFVQNQFNNADNGQVDQVVTGSINPIMNQQFIPLPQKKNQPESFDAANGFVNLDKTIWNTPQTSRQGNKQSKPIEDKPQ